MWLVIHEYETYCHSEPVHAWHILDRKETKKEAEERAIELNYKYYCENYQGRYPNQKDTSKKKIVQFVLKNINSKTGSRNGKFGTGIWILDQKKYNLDPNVDHFDSLQSSVSETQSHKDEDTNEVDVISDREIDVSVKSTESGLGDSSDDED